MITQINLTPTNSTFIVPKSGATPIIARSWGLPGDCQGIALLVHGLGANSGWFEAFATELKSRRIYAVSYDQVGFGNRANVNFSRYQQWLDDLILVFDYLRKQTPNKPIYLIGNSMGALLSMACAQFAAPDGLILLSPGFDGHPGTFTTWYRFQAVVKAICWPEAPLALPYGVDQFARISSVRDWVINDTQGNFDVPGKMLFELLKLSNATKSKALKITMPVLMITAGMDTIVDNRVSRALFEKLSAPEKSVEHFPEAFHDLMFDPVVDEVADKVVGWMAAHAREGLTTGLTP